MVLLEDSEGELGDVVDVNVVEVPAERVVDRRNTFSSARNLVSV